MNQNVSKYIASLLYVPTKIDYFACVALHPIGLVLHLFSLYIYQKPSMKKTNMGYLFTWQSCVDVVYLLYLIVNVQSEINTYFVQFDELCKLTNFVVKYFYNLSPWTNAFICLERFLFVFFPRSCHLMKSKRNLAALFLILFVLVALPSVSYFTSFISKTRVRWNNQTDWIVDCRIDSNLSKAMIIINPLMRPVLPTSLIILMNVLMLKGIKENKKRCVNKGTKEKRSSRREKRFTSVVISMSIVFVAFNLPSLLIYIYDLIFVPNRNTTQEAWANYMRFSIVITHFSILYQSGYFFVLLASNNIFRSEVFRLFGITSQSAAAINEQPSRTSKWATKTKLK
jgi:hypothetical protein